VDPEDPRAPTLAVWERMTAAEREHVLASLPSEFEVDAAAPPEGDYHFNAKMNTRKTLGRFFDRIGRRVYLACELPVYYPGERMFAPDLMAVLDVNTNERPHWVVAHEGKGLDLALEIFVSGSRRKDHERNVERYARLGIREYFIFDRGRLRLTGYRLKAPGTYQPILPQSGQYPSDVLGLSLAIAGERLRFFVGDAEVPEAEELIDKLEGMVRGLESRLSAAEYRALEEARLREEEARLREEEARLREEAEQRLERALAELQRLRDARDKPK
jgi:Uma2 family endonuclease